MSSKIEIDVGDLIVGEYCENDNYFVAYCYKITEQRIGSPRYHLTYAYTRTELARMDTEWMYMSEWQTPSICKWFNVKKCKKSHE